MNILFFNRSFYPDTGATGQFLTELCEDLTDKGCNVTVIAGRSYGVNYLERKLISFEKYKSINIIRVGGTFFSKRFLLLRLVNLGTYFLLAFLAGFLVKTKPHVILAQTDPPLLGIHGLFFSKYYKAKFIYSCKDLYPEVGIVTKKLTDPFFNFLLDKINKFSFKFADAVFCLGEDMKQKIKNKGVIRDEIFVIRDWANTKSLFPVVDKDNLFKTKFGLNEKFTIMYSGNIGLTQNLDMVIDAAKAFKNKDEIKFLFIGEGADKANLQEKVNNLELKNVQFLSYQPKEELRYSLGAADLHLITLEKGLSGIVVPSKIYGILSCGKPFIALVDEESDVSLIAKKFSCGIMVSPGDKESLVKAVEWAVNHREEIKKMGLNGREAAVKYFDRKISTDLFYELTQKVIFKNHL